MEDEKQVYHGYRCGMKLQKFPELWKKKINKY